MGARLNTGADDDLAENSDINVTPFIDVMLVLLIIFMVAAPLATVDMPVDLPASTAKPQEPPKDPLFLVVKADKTMTIGDEPVSRETIAAVLDRVSSGDKETRVFLRAEKAVPYGDLTGAMNALRLAGYTKIALVGLSNGAAAPAP